MPDLLADLNDAQRQAVTHGNGPLMIVAGAGTGKTTVITRRIAWLIESGFATSSQILALTFTEKAAGEMEERVDELLPIGHLDLSVHTFHAFCERVLREHGMEIGLARDFTVLTEIDAWLLARRHFDRFDLKHYKPLGNPTRYLRGLLRHFASLKEEGVWPEDYGTFARNQKQETGNRDEESDIQRLEELAIAYEVYEHILHEANALDFGGLILYTLKLFKERPVVLETLRRRYHYILVDEFQDTNASQYVLVGLLAALERNLTVVGDDDQSIYRFRGASISNILTFDRDYPDASHVVLTTNYRSHQEILNAAYRFIQHNNPARLEVKIGLSKELSAHKASGGVVEHLHYPSLEDEARGVLEKILGAREKDATLAWKDIGILVRANDHAAPFVEAFERRGVPYQFLAMRGLYAKPIILDMMAWLRVIDNPFDSVSAYRVLTHPVRAIETNDLERLTHAAHKQGKPILEVNLDLAHDLSAGARASVESVRTLRQELADLARRKRATEMLIFAARTTGLVEWVSALPDAEAKETFAFLQQLYARMRGFESRSDEKSLHHFLEEFAHEREAGETGALDFDIETGPDTVRIMTVHASKGLEFRHVFIVNMVDRRFPSQHRTDAIPVPEELIPAVETGEHLEEERRLLYVAMTRAQERLFLTSADDYGGSRNKKPSLFLHELGLVAQEKNRPTGQAIPTHFPPEVADDASILKREKSEMILELPKQFSFTQYAAYRTCPLQYKFAHLLKIPVLPNHQMSFGKTMHAALQAFFEQWMREGVLPSREVLLHLYDTLWINEWYPNDVERESYRERGRRSLETLHADLKANPPKPLAIERPFTLKLGGAILKGQIDRVDELEGGLHLIDYKTGAPKTLEDLRPEQKDQLYLYQMAAEEIWRKPVRRLTYAYLEENRNVDFVGSEADLGRTRERVERVIDGVKAGMFEPTPGNHCSFCDFRDICPFRAR